MITVPSARAPTKPAGAVLATLLLALGVGACGSTVSTSSFKGEAHAVAQRISDLQSDVSALNEQKICEQDFSRAARARLSTGGNTCKQALKRQLGTIDAYELTVEKIAVSGATATAHVRSTWAGKLSGNGLKLVKEDGGWRVEGVG
jgi:putative lumazine-binding protein